MYKKIVAVLGAAGYIGSQIAKAVANSDCYELIPILRNDSVEKLIFKVDIVVHSANPAKRWQANNNPKRDFKETVDKTENFFLLSEGKRFIQISSLSCRTQPRTPYGYNRQICERMVLSDPSSLVIRLGSLFGGSRKKDVLHDILAGRRVYVASETQYAYVDVAWAGQKIVELLDGPTGIVEIGARNAVCLNDLCKYFNSKSIFSGKEDSQIPGNSADGPDANEVYDFAIAEYAKMRGEK